MQCTSIVTYTPVKCS